MDFNRARALMEEHGIDALLVAGPDNVAYTLGATAIPPAHMWRQFGPYLAIIPADPSIPTAAIVSDTHGRMALESGRFDEVRTHPIWIEYADATELEGTIQERMTAAMRGRPPTRPETWDLQLVLPLLRSALADRGLDNKRIGVDLANVAIADQPILNDVLGRAKIVDSTHIFRELRLIKSEWEIDLLRTAVKLTDAAITAATDAVKVGDPIHSVSLNFKRGIIDAAAAAGVTNLTGSWDLVSVGDRPWSAATKTTIELGDIIKFDCGAIVGGYVADYGRIFSVGSAAEASLAVSKALHAGMQGALEALMPGATFADVFHAAQNGVRAAGFPGYTRGHFGHSIGNDMGPEEWPWISATETRVIEPNMVLALETPFYIDGVGGFMIEHNIVVRNDGIEVLDQLPEEMVEIG